MCLHRLGVLKGRQSNCLNNEMKDTKFLYRLWPIGSLNTMSHSHKRRIRKPLNETRYDKKIVAKVLAVMTLRSVKMKRVICFFFWESFNS